MAAGSFLDIAEAAAYFEHPLKQYALFKDVEDRIAERQVDGTPPQLLGNRRAMAYFGIMRLAVGDDVVLGSGANAYTAAASDIEAIVTTAVAENSLNPASIEAAIRQAVLPRLFPLTGLDYARTITDQVVEVTRVGLSRDVG